MQNPPMRHILTWTELKLAIFMSIVILLVAVSIFFSELFSSLFQKKLPLSITTDNVGGLRIGAPVWLQGITVGTVNKIDFTSNSEIVYITIGKEYQQFLYKDASAEIKGVGLLGSKYVELIRGAPSSGTIKYDQNIKGELTDPLKNVDESLNTTIKNISSLVNNINKKQGVAGTLVNDTLLANDLKATAASFRALIEELQKNPKKFINVKIF
jgi:phospholipid/cholesterol/gamma-HCH transport system substrate-binding protein